MKHSVIRPATTELALTLFARTLHPELFQSCEKQIHETSQYRVEAELTRFGHVLQFQVGRRAVTQVLDSQFAELPKIRRLGQFRCNGSRNLNYSLDGGLKIQICYSCEYLDADLYKRVEQEYWQQAGKANLVYIHNSGPEDETAALSFMTLHAAADAYGADTFMLYPEESAICKTQVLFTLNTAEHV